MKITPRIAMEVLQHEGIVREAYLDSADILTWGVGITDASGHKVRRYIDNPQPLERVLDVYIWALDNYSDDVREVFAGHDLTEEQFGAAVSFHYNTGGIRRAEWAKSWKAGDVDRAYRQFMNWRSPPEVIPRREAERDLFLGRGTWTHTGVAIEWPVGADRRPDWTRPIRHDVMPILQSLMGEATDVQPPKADAPEVAPEVPFDLAAARAEIAALREHLGRAKVAMDRLEDLL